MTASSERPGILLTVAYDGEEFSGFARQPGVRTVQGTLEVAIAAMDGAPALVRGASRTDAGVHAAAHPVAFDPQRVIAPLGWLRGLNRMLGPDLAVRDARACVPGYNPRFDAVRKHYRYRVHVSETRDPLSHRAAWHLLRMRRRIDGGTAATDLLDVATMQAAANTLLGTHDFRAFRAADDTRENTVRTLERVDVVPGAGDERELLDIHVVGTAFMKNMVRILAGTLVEVGRGRRTVDEVAALLAAGSARADAGMTAPAHGLTLLEVVLGRGQLATT